MYQLNFFNTMYAYVHMYISIKARNDLFSQHLEMLVVILRIQIRLPRCVCMYAIMYTN